MTKVMRKRAWKIMNERLKMKKMRLRKKRLKTLRKSINKPRPVLLMAMCRVAMTMTFPLTTQS